MLNDFSYMSLTVPGLLISTQHRIPVANGIGIPFFDCFTTKEVPGFDAHKPEIETVNASGGGRNRAQGRLELPAGYLPFDKIQRIAAEKQKPCQKIKILQ